MGWCSPRASMTIRRRRPSGRRSSPTPGWRPSSGSPTRGPSSRGSNPDFRLCLLVFARGGATESFTAAFRIEPKDALPPDRLETFLGDEGEHLRWSRDLVERLAPGSLVVPEDKRQIDLDLLARAFRFPALGSEVAESWTLRLAKEFDSTNDSYLFRTAPAPHRLPLYEGRMIGPFTTGAGAPRYWLEEEEARRALLGRKADTGQHLEYQGYRLGFRDGVRGSGEGPLVLAMLPPGVFSNDKLPTALLRSAGGFDLSSSLFLCAVLNSSIVGYLLRQRAAASVTFSILSQLPVPRPEPGTSAFSSSGRDRRPSHLHHPRLCRPLAGRDRHLLVPGGGRRRSGRAAAPLGRDRRPGGPSLRSDGGGARPCPHDAPRGR